MRTQPVRYYMAARTDHEQ